MGTRLQFSFPGGIPSHVAPETPGSIHEGGELGYALVHAYGAAFDNPDLVVACVIGDGEAETGPLAASWHSNKFLDPPATAWCFHGLSHAWAAGRAAEMAPGSHRVVTCHLGAVARRRARRAQCRHHHGFHAARRAGHGHAQRVGRSRPDHVAGGVRGPGPTRGRRRARTPLRAARAGGHGRHAGAAEPDTDISARGAGTHGGVRVLVIASREDLQIAAGVERALAPGSRS